MIGTNKKCAQETVQHLLDDVESATLLEPGGARSRPRSRSCCASAADYVSFAGWQAIDAAEVARGEPQGRPRVKFVRVEEMLEAGARAVPGAVADLAELKSMIEAALPGAEVEVVDETGGGDHLRANVARAQFEGLRRIDQHRLVKAAVQERFDDGTIHALSVEDTYAVASSAVRRLDS